MNRRERRALEGEQMSQEENDRLFRESLVAVILGALVIVCILVFGG